MKALLRGTLATLVGSMTLFVASTALADGEACYNDTDCPGTACGDAVCNWSRPATNPTSDKPYYCNPAGTKPKKSDGWCTTDDNCKCKSLGATCKASAPYCSFTKPSDAPAGTSGSSTGGAAPTAGTTSTPTAGTTSTPTAGTASGGTGSTTPAASSGGCSLSVPGGSNTGLALGVGLLGLGLAFARRRR